VSERRDLLIAPLLTATLARARLAWQRPRTVLARVAATSKPVLALHMLLMAISILACIRIGHALIGLDVQPGTRVAQPVVAQPLSDARIPRRPGSTGGYDVIATRTLFDPNRAQPATSATVARSTLPAPTLVLVGVAISDDSRVAFVQDPSTNRIAGYKLGDTLAGGQVELIEADRVLIARTDGPIEVRLHQPKGTVPVAGVPEEVSPRRSRGRQE